MIFYTTSGSLPKYTRHTKNLAQEKIDCLDVWLFLPSGVICTVSDAEKDSRQEEKGMTKDEMVGWHHRLDGHEFEQAPGVGDGQGSLACYSPRGCKESDTTE